MTNTTAKERLQYFQVEPYPYYKELRARKEHETMSGAMPHIKWSHMITRYDEVAQLLKHPSVGCNPKHGGGKIDVQNAWWIPKGFRAWTNGLIFQDDADHSRLRKLVSKAFKPSMIKQWEGMIQDLTNQLLDEMEQKAARNEPVDFHLDFARPLPLLVIAEMMGVSDNDAGEFATYSLRLVDKLPKNYLDLISELPNFVRLHRFLAKLVAHKRKYPGEDLTTALIEAEEDGDKLSEIELASMLLVLLAAGHETTINLLGGGLLALLRNPDQAEKFKQNPELAGPMCEEIVRYVNPIQGISRYAKEDFELNGRTIKKGENMMLYLGSANRDEAKFENPDQFDITRNTAGHLAYGLGVHFCLGAQLARLEGIITFKTLFERFPDVKLAKPVEELGWRKSNILRGLTELPIKLK